MPDAKRRGYKAGRFSFNVKGGRCEACEGNGKNKLEMDFLADIWVQCPVCAGKRFNRETLQIQFKDHSISDVLELDVRQAMELFENIPKIYDKLKTLSDVGLDYLKLGQASKVVKLLSAESWMTSVNKRAVSPDSFSQVGERSKLRTNDGLKPVKR